MDTILPELAKYGFGGVMVALTLWYLFKTNASLTAKIDKQTDWQIEFIENNTKATIGSTSAQLALTNTIQILVDTVKGLDQTIRDRIAR